MGAPITQLNFSGGMNLFDSEILLGSNEYALAYNVRNRTAKLQSLNGPDEDELAPVGFKQGIYAFDKYVLLFNNGEAYYKNIILDDSIWTKIVGLTLNTTVDYIYTQVIPASRFNYDRKLTSDNQIEGNKQVNPISVLPNLINGSDAGLIVQDGVQQGYIIKANGTARRLKTFAEWTLVDREYVPIMKQMAYVNGILFGIDITGTILYRSVSGRPMDFVVDVDTTGYKGDDANKTAYSIGQDTVTCLKSLSNGQLLVATNKVCSPLTLNYDKTIFNEPTFININGFSAGIVNQFSIVEYLRDDGTGFIDYYFIDTDGLRSFNSASSNQNEGRNSNFSYRISQSLVTKQIVTAAITFNDYSMFSIKTIYNDDNLIAVYDNKRETWVCFDNYNIGTIKQFAVADQSDNPTLYAITSDKVYKLFSLESYLTSTVRIKSAITGSLKTQLKLMNIYSTLLNGTLVGTVNATEYCNGVLNKTVTQPLLGKLTENLRFNFQGLGSQCFRTQPEISWNTDAELAGVEIEIEGETQATPIQQQARAYG